MHVVSWLAFNPPYIVREADAVTLGFVNCIAIASLTKPVTAPALTRPLAGASAPARRTRVPTRVRPYNTHTYSMYSTSNNAGAAEGEGEKT